MPVQSLDWENPLEKGMATRSSILALETPMDRGAWQAAVHRISQSWTQLKWPSTHVICIKLGVYVCTPFFHPLALCIWRSTTLSWNKLSLFVWCCETVLGVVNPKLSFQRNIKIEVHFKPNWSNRHIQNIPLSSSRIHILLKYTRNFLQDRS